MMPRALSFYYRTPSPMREPPEPRESAIEATEQPGRVETQPSVEGAQEPAQPPRSWWRRMFGGQEAHSLPVTNVRSVT